jgi:phage-related holin
MKEKLAAASLEIVAFLVIFFADLQSALFALGFLIMADTFTGIWAAWKRKGRKSVTSRKLGRIIAKFILYPLALIVAKVAEEYLSPAIPWTDVTAGILAIVEVKSIFENISIVLGFDLWEKLKKQIWKDKIE